MSRKLLCIVDCDVLCHDSEFHFEAEPTTQTLALLNGLVGIYISGNAWTRTPDGRDLCPDCARAEEAREAALPTRADVREAETRVADLEGRTRDGTGVVHMSAKHHDWLTGRIRELEGALRELCDDIRTNHGPNCICGAVHGGPHSVGCRVEAARALLAPAQVGEGAK